jgi:hypothetical protein
VNPVNHSDTPLVSVQIACHSGDAHLFPRAFASVLAQTLNHKQIQVVVCFDGTATEEEFAHIARATTAHDFYSVDYYETETKYGYYTVPRNASLLRCWGFYQAFLDSDNEWKPAHLATLLEAIRTPTDDGWPHFVYSRRRYVIDEGCTDTRAVEGDSPLTLWTPENLARLVASPTGNFVDTGDFLVGRGLLAEMGERYGYIWHPEDRRFGDRNLMVRFAEMGTRGLAVDTVSHIYHWTGTNLQLTRKNDEFIYLPIEEYEAFKAQGLFK